MDTFSFAKVFAKGVIYGKEIFKIDKQPFGG